MLNEADLRRAASESGFRPDALEKVIRLLELLEGIVRHPFLRNRVALKGGTALNLFLLDVPRLSVDVDLNYIGASDPATAKAERPKVERVGGEEVTSLARRSDRLPVRHAALAPRRDTGQRMKTGG